MCQPASVLLVSGIKTNMARFSLIFLAHHLAQLGFFCRSLGLRIALLGQRLPFLFAGHVGHECFLERVSVVVNPVELPVSAHALLVPADLSAVGLAVLLGVELRGANRSACVHEEKARHGQGGQGRHHSLPCLSAATSNGSGIQPAYPAISTLR